MAFRDQMGNGIEEGCHVAMALGNGQLVNGRVTKTTALVAAPNQPQIVVVQFSLLVQAAPDGTVPGLFKIAVPETTRLAE